MLQATLTKNNTGITLKGDFFDLEYLYGVLHDFVNEIDEENFESNNILALAYEVRKAMQDARGREEFTTPFAEDITLYYYSTEYVLPYLLVTIGILRHRLAYRRMDAKHYAMVYLLEALAEKALSEGSDQYGPGIWQTITNLNLSCDDYAAPLLEMATLDFLALSKARKLSQLVPIMKRYFNPGLLREETISQLKKDAKRLNTSVDKLTYEWPEIKW